MKTGLFVALGVVLATAATAQIRYTVKGDIEGLPKGTVFLVNNEKPRSQADSMKVSDGEFSFEGTCEAPFSSMLLFRVEGQRPLIRMSDLFFVEDGLTEIKGVYGQSAGMPEISGQKLTTALQAFLDKMVGLRREYKEAADKAAVDKKIKGLIEETIAANSDNQLGLFVLLSSGMSVEEKAAASSLLSAEAQKSPRVAQLKITAEGMKKRAPGQKFTDFKLPAPDGRQIALSDVVGPGKYVLVDFWASWCGPCMGEVPHLKAAYEKYHDKGFEIFGVSYDSKREAWLGAIEKQGMPWVHVSALQGWKCPTKDMYGVNGIPTSILIGPDGVIIGGDYRGDALDEQLSKIFND